MPVYMFMDGAECFENYQPGGYHPVMIDDLLHDRYRIVDKLGYGSYSIIWLAFDEKVKSYVALKIGVSDSPSVGREIEILRKLSGSASASPALSATHDEKALDAVPAILDEFNVSGPNGTHKCYTLAPAQSNLADPKYCQLISLQIARALAAKLVIALEFVHSRGFVHGDLQSRNMLVKMTSSLDELSIPEFREKFGDPITEPIRRLDEKPLPPNIPSQGVLGVLLGKSVKDFTLVDARNLIISDFGEAFSPATEQRPGRKSHITQQLRAPETFFEPDEPMSYPSDIWSLALSIWEILGMQHMVYEMSTDSEVIEELIDVLGYENFPEDWKKLWERPGEEDKLGGKEESKAKESEAKESEAKESEAKESEAKESEAKESEAKESEAKESEDEEDYEYEPIPRKPCPPSRPSPDLEGMFEQNVQSFRRKKEGAEVFGEEETQAILELMRSMLKFRPEERLTAQEVLQSRWMVQWALPALNESLDKQK